ncbi:MAG: hypothetical protein ACXADC_03850 [Candidatus Thorarchaeota archaeon]
MNRNTNAIDASKMIMNGSEAPPMKKNGKMKKNPVSKVELDKIMMSNPTSASMMPKHVSRSDFHNIQSHTSTAETPGVLKDWRLIP